MKATFHKSCSCRMCKRGRATEAGKFKRHQNERKLRRDSKAKLNEVVKGRADDAEIHPISSDYTD